MPDRRPLPRTISFRTCALRDESLIVAPASASFEGANTVNSCSVSVKVELRLELSTLVTSSVRFKSRRHSRTLSLSPV